MKVKNLIEVLTTLDQELPVVIIDAGRGYELDVGSINEENLYFYKLKPDGNREETYNNAIVIY